MSATKPEIDNVGKLGTCNESSVPHVWHEICASWTPQSVSVDVERELYLALSEMLSGWRKCPDQKCICKVCQSFAVIKLYEGKVKP